MEKEKVTLLSLREKKKAECVACLYNPVLNCFLRCCLLPFVTHGLNQEGELCQVEEQMGVMIFNQWSWAMIDKCRALISLMYNFTEAP